MAIDNAHLAMMTLATKNAALDKATTELKNSLNGDFNHDAPIVQRSASIHAEQAQIASRISAILGGLAFTPPTDAQVNSLSTAVATLDADVKSSALLITILADATTVMKQYGAGSSSSPTVPEPN